MSAESMSRCRLNARRLRYAYTSMNVATGNMMAIACIGTEGVHYVLGSAKVCLAGCVKSLPAPKGRRIEGLGQDKPLTPPRL